jgi:peptide/nickel transport system ATP-binding protein/oligopeptide transport system ATP-binding protein
MDRQELGLHEPLLRVENLQKQYPLQKSVFSWKKGYIRAVDQVSFSVQPGETLGLVGESGCGKSTTGKMIARLEEPTGGKIFFQNEEISALSVSRFRKRRSQLQFIFQDPYSALNPRKRVADILAEPLLVHQLADRGNVHQEVDRLLEIVGLTKGSKFRYPHQFSGGQRQRIGIARAISLRPRLIVCDEPVSALDVSIQAQILNLLKDLQREYQLAYLFIAHGLGAVRYISDRIAVMYLGRIVEVARTEEIFQSPRHPYTRALLDAYPLPQPQNRSRNRIVLQGEVPNLANPPQGCRFHTRCPLAQAICREVEPVMSKENHPVACHFPLN